MSTVEKVVIGFFVALFTVVFLLLHLHEKGIL